MYMYILSFENKMCHDSVQMVLIEDCCLNSFLVDPARFHPCG